MIENSSHGLTMLDPDHEVVVTREEHHQQALLAYAPHGDGRPRRVAVELCFAPIAHGTHAGQRGIEVRLDGLRVGELTVRMSQRYGPLVEDVLRGGGRPGCVALVVQGRRGIEVELRLPDGPADVAPPGSPLPPRPAPNGPPPGRPGPADPAGRARRSRKPYWIGAGVVTLLLVIGANVGDGDDTAVMASPGTAPPTSTAAPTGTTAPAALAAPGDTASPRDTATPGDTARPGDTATSNGEAAAPVAPAAAPSTTVRLAPATTPPQPAPKPQPAPDPEPEPVTQPDPEPDVYYQNCDAVRAAGKAPIRVGDPGYRSALDRDGDGQGCGQD